VARHNRPGGSDGDGQLLTQVRASGELALLADMRAVIRKSSDVGRFEPRQAAVWHKGVERFQKLRSRAL
jgi:hypothetical protein